MIDKIYTGAWFHFQCEEMFCFSYFCPNDLFSHLTVFLKILKIILENVNIQGQF